MGFVLGFDRFGFCSRVRYVRKFERVKIMFDSFTVRAAYGRRYSSQRAIKADFLAGRDFQLVDGGQYINLEDCQRGGIPTITVRYDSDKKSFVCFASWAKK